MPDNTALRVALWRALHVRVDAPPHVLEDELGLRLVAPEDGWRERSDMHPQLKISSRSARTRALRNTSCSARASTRSHSANRKSRPACSCSKSISPKRRRGSSSALRRLAEHEERAIFERAIEGARASGTPFLSFFTPEEMRQLARDCGFAHVQRVSAADLTERYFSGRSDGLRPGTSEELLIASTAACDRR